MAQVVLNLKEKTLDEKIALAGDLATNVAADAIHFATPVPTTAEVISKKNAAAAAKAAAMLAKDAYTTAVNYQDQCASDLDAILTMFGVYIFQASGGNATIIESTGAKSKQEGNDSPLPPKVAAVSLTQGDNQYEIDIHWHRIAKEFNLKNFQIRYAVGEATPTNWTIYDKTTAKSSIIFNIGQQDVRVWIEVRAVNATGEGPWSDIATIEIAVHL